MTGSPQTSAIAVFQDQIATGKLNAVITATTPSGCQVSMRRCPGRSDGMVRPYSCRDSPTAKSQMSIISWTSPSASEPILPASRVTSAARSARCWDSSSPNRFTSAPRAGAGTARQRRKASWARAMAASTSWGEDQRIRASSAPRIGVVVRWSPPSAAGATPQLARLARARSRRHSAVGSDWLMAGMVPPRRLRQRLAGGQIPSARTTLRRYPGAAPAPPPGQPPPAGRADTRRSPVRQRIGRQLPRWREVLAARHHGDPEVGADS